jgi:hypothetical protein
MLSLYLRKDKSENSSVENFGEQLECIFLVLPMLKLKPQGWDKTLKLMKLFEF